MDEFENFDNLEAQIQKLENPKTRNRLAEVTNKPTNYILDTLDKAFEYDGTENLDQSMLSRENLDISLGESAMHQKEPNPFEFDDLQRQRSGEMRPSIIPQVSLMNQQIQFNKGN